MGRPQLLPGEHEELRIKPAALGYGVPYAAALAPAAAAGVLWLIGRLPAWQDAESGAPPWQIWHHLWGDALALALYAVTLVVAAALIDYAVRRKARSFLLATAALAYMMSAVSLLGGMDSRDAIPLLVASLSVPALAWVEARRRTTRYVLTNLRLVRRSRLPRHAEEGVRHQDLVDLRAKRIVGDVGTLVPVLGQDAAGAAAGGPASRTPMRLRGVRPFGRVRAFTELLVQRATAGDYLRAEGRLEQRIAEARVALQRRA